MGFYPTPREYFAKEKKKQRFFSFAHNIFIAHTHGTCQEKPKKIPTFGRGSGLLIGKADFANSTDR
jgi:hypothetical protein